MKKRMLIFFVGMMSLIGTSYIVFAMEIPLIKVNGPEKEQEKEEGKTDPFEQLKQEQAKRWQQEELQRVQDELKEKGSYQRVEDELAILQALKANLDEMMSTQEWQFVGTTYSERLESDQAFYKRLVEDNLTFLNGIAELQKEESELVKKLTDLGLEKVEKIKRVSWQPSSELNELIKKFSPARVTPPSAVPTLPEPSAAHFTAMQKKVTIGAGVFTIAMLTLAIVSYIGQRAYLQRKNTLLKKYGISSLTPLQNKIWMAIALAAVGIPQPLRYIIQNNPRPLGDLVVDEEALAELYYRHEPTEQEIKEFMQNFFGGV